MPGSGLYIVGSGETYTTIQSALDKLWIDQGGADFTATQTILVLSGTYQETATPNSGLKPTPEFKLVIYGASSSTGAVVDAQNTRFSGIAIINIDNVVVDGFGFIGIKSGGCGVVCYGCDNIVIKNTTPHDNLGSGIYITGCTNGLIYNNICFLNDEPAIYVASSASIGIYNNTCYDNSVEVLVSSGSTNIAIHNNILWNTTDVCLSIYISPGCNNTSDYNDLLAVGTGIFARIVEVGGRTTYTTFANWKSGTGFDAHSKNVDPHLVNIGGPVSTDYKIAYPSDCINSGIDLGNESSIDYFGTHRSAYRLWDIGAHQYLPKIGMLGGYILTSNGTHVAYQD